jgi:hypothetical protein
MMVYATKAAALVNIFGYVSFVNTEHVFFLMEL